MNMKLATFFGTAEQTVPGASIVSKSLLTLAVSCGISCLAVAADLNEEISFDIPAQSLSLALADFSRQASTNVAATTESTSGKMSKAVKETTTPVKALMRLLEGTDLQYRVQGNGAIVVEPS